MVKDLSEYGRMVGGLFPHPTGDSSEFERYRLSDEQVAFFHENGYLHDVKILEEEQVDALREELAVLMNGDSPERALFHEYHLNESDDPDKVLFHALGAWRAAGGFHDLLWHPAFTVPASQLLGGAVRFWHDQLFCKPAKHGGVVAWHQDYSYWTRTQPMAHLTCWIGLDDATVDNGCVMYIPGSHKWPLLPITGLAGDMNAIQTVLSEDQRKQFRPVAAEMKVGYATFHHPLMVHGSYDNKTDIPRRATVINVFRDGVKSDKDEPLLNGADLIPKGEKMGGRFFPLLRAGESL